MGALFILFLSLHMAVSYENTKSNPLVREIHGSNGQLEKKENFNTPVFFADFADRIEKKPTDIEYVKSTPKFLFGGIVLSLFIGMYIYVSRRKMINGKEYGTAEWATKKDIQNLFAKYIANKEIKEVKHKTKNEEEKKIKIKEIQEKYEDADMIFTSSEKICMYNFELNNNTTIVGGSGAGKTRGYALPNLLQAHSSFIVTDPKGEIISKIGYFLSKIKGYKLRVLNLDEKELSSGYNPLYYIHRNRRGWEERVLTLIETIILNTDGGEKKNSSDPFWDKAERLFLQAVIFFTVEAFPSNECNMNTVMELIKMLEIGEEEDNRDSDLDLFCDRFAAKYGEDHIGVEQFGEFRSKASGKTAKSIVISAVARLAPFKLKEVRRIMSYDDMHLETVGEEKTAIFVVVPPTDKTFNFIAGILFTQLFQELQYCALNVHKDIKRLPVPCRFILDEFANTCKIPNFIEILSYARSLGIGITIILQSLEQIKEMYEKQWGIIIDTTDTLLYLGKVKHVDTLKYLSEMLGKGTFDKQSTSRTKGRQSSNSTSSDRFGRELLDPSEIRKIPNSKCLLLIGGKNPFYSRKYNYKKHKNYKFTSDYNKKYLYEYIPFSKEEVDNGIIENEKKYRNNLKLTPLVKVIAEGQETIDLIEKSLLNLDFDKDELLQVSDGERENIELYNELLAEEQQEEQEMLDITEKIASIEVVTDISAVMNNLNSLIQEQESGSIVDFDDQTVNDGEEEIEEIEIDDGGEEFELDIDEQLEHLIDDSLELEENMEDFLKDINKIDENVLVNLENSDSEEGV